MTLAEAYSMVISPDDFDPPLKRKEAHVPGYWSIDELAAELEVSTRFIQYRIKDDMQKKEPMLKIFKIGSSILVSDTEALAFLREMRQSKPRRKLNNS